MAELIPENFRELLSALCLVIGTVFSFASLSANKREHTLRLAGLFLLSSIALFANDAWCYFATVFIIATAVTQLHFLQNLAAIIRGSKEYFDYQKEFLSPKEIEESAEKQVEEIDQPGGDAEARDPSPTPITTGNDVSLTLDGTQLSPQQFGVICEEYAFRFLERKYGQPIERHIRYRGRGMLAEFDGVMRDGDRDIVFELKVFRRPHAAIFITRSLGRWIESARSYRLLTKRRTSLVLVIVGEPSETVRRRLDEYIVEHEATDSDLKLSWESYSFNDIGLSALIASKRAEPSAEAKSEDRSARP